MVRIFLLIVFLFCSAFNYQAQSNFSVGVRAGILEGAGKALGSTVVIKKNITSDFKLTLNSSYYNWNNKNDYSVYRGVYHQGQMYIKKFIDYLIPVRVGLEYNFGKSKSRPYLAIEWAVNFIANEIHYPYLIETDTFSYIMYDKEKSKSAYASFGFCLGYSFFLNDNFNIDFSVVSHTGGNLQYANFSGGINYNL